MTLPVVLLALCVPPVCFFPGWALLRRAGLGAAERFAVAWGIGIFLMAAGQFLSFIVRADPRSFNLIFWAVVMAGAGLAFFGRGARHRGSRRDLLVPAGIWALTYLHLVCIQALLPAYVGGRWFGDWWMHYSQALVFLGREDLNTVWFDQYTIASRTPLFNLAGAFLLSLIGDGFWAFQLGSALFASVFACSAYLLVRSLLGTRAAAAGTILAGLNLWLLHNGWFTWPKMLAGFYLLLALHFYLRFLTFRGSDPGRGSQMIRLAWVVSLGAYLTHQSAAAYILAMALHLAVLRVRDRLWGVGRRDLAVLAVSLVLLVLPWYLWLATQLPVAELFDATPVTRMDPTHRVSATSAVLVAAHNIVYSFLPKAVVEAVIRNPSLAGAYRGATVFYFNLAIGALTVSVTVALLWMGARFARSRRGRAPLREALRPSEWAAILFFVVLGGLGTALLHPVRSTHGIAHAVMVPSTAVLAVLGWGILCRFSPRAATWVFLRATIEFLVMFWTHVAFVGRGIVLPVDGNWELKRIHDLVFLADRVGSAGFVVGAISVQFALAAFLWSTLRNRGWAGDPVPEGKTG